MDKATKEFLATLPLAERKKWLRDKGIAEREWDQVQADNQPRFGDVPLNGKPMQMPKAGMAQPVFMANVDQAKAIAGNESAFQNALANDMGDEVEQAIQRENESRVAQSRELRRMEHERALEAMRQETERQKTAALIARLDAQSGKKVVRFPGGMITHG